MRSMLLPLMVSLPIGALAHGMMTKPVSRNGGTLALAGCPHDSNNAPGPCADHQSWFCGTDLAPVPCKSQPTTKTLEDKYKTSPEGFKGTKVAPWESPGFAEPASSCGTTYYNRDGDKLPKSPAVVWQQKSTVEVGWAIWANHGGGYTWRLCPSNQDLTEDCFEQNLMHFVDDNTALRYNDGTPDVVIPAMTTTTGTKPVGSQWRRNPIPSLEFPGSDGKPAFTPPCNGCQGSKSPVQIQGNKGLNFSLVDKVLVPDLPNGDYVLQWRWDTEDDSQQVWTNCADVMLGDKSREEIFT